MKRTVKIMVILGLLALCGTAWGVEPIPNLISHWTFDEGSGTTAYDSVGSNHGTIYGAQWTTGQIDGALSFDGVDDYVDLDAHIGDFQNLSTGTLSVWIKKESTGNTGIFFSSSDGGDNYSSMYFRKMPDEKIKIRISQNDISKLYWNSDGILPFGWHHFAYTTDSSGHCAYLDGVPLTGFYTVGSPSTSAFFSHIPDQDSMRIGNLHKTNIDCYRWDGLIDDVRIYDRALSAEEVQQLYQDGLAEVVELEIIGPDEVAENFSASYKAIAYYDNNSTKDVTDSADWLVEPNSIASIDGNGLLTTEEIYTPQEDITIYAQYTEGEVTVKAEKAVTIFAICPTGTALQFDGDGNYVEIPDDDSLTPANEITISFWIHNRGGQDAGIFKYSPCSANPPSPGNSRAYYICIIGSGDRTSKVLFGIFSSVNNSDSIISNNTVPLNQWHHVAATFNRGNAAVYIDGQLDNSATLSVSSIMNDAQPLFVGGCWSYCDGERWVNRLNGKADDVRIYDRALSAEEIRANMHARLNGDELGLVGYWDFDEGEGQIAYDLSGNDNHGQLGFTPNADASDPAWIESDAPIGICTPEELVERNLSDVLDIKLDILEQLGIALAKEEAVVDMLNTFFKNRDFGSAKKKDVGKAKKKIHSAIKHEKKSKKELEKSIEKLEDALAMLGWEPPFPVSHWALDEDSGDIAYDSAGDSDGTVYGAQWTTGQIEGALSFDGDDDYVDIPYDPSLDIDASDGITVSAWIKLESYPDNTQGPVFGLYDSMAKGTKNYLLIGKAIYGNKITWDQYPQSWGFLESIKPDLDEWYHVVAVQNSTYRAIYINGTLDSSDNSPESYSGDTPDTIRIGSRADGLASFYFDGIIDDVRIYDQALSAEEVRLLYYNRLD